MTTPLTPSETEVLKMFDEILKDFLIQQLAWEKSRHPEQFGMIDGSPVLQEMAEKRYEALKETLLSSIRLAHEAGINKENERWLHQPANEHDQKIRADERKQIIQEIEDLHKSYVIQSANADESSTLKVSLESRKQTFRTIIEVLKSSVGLENTTREDERKQAYEDGKNAACDYAASERDKVAKTTDDFNALNDEYKEGYWIAMNTVLKYLNARKANY